MSILTNLKNMDKDDVKEESKCFSDDILGMHNAIKNFVEAKRGEANTTDKSKFSVIKKAVKTSKK